RAKRAQTAPVRRPGGVHRGLERMRRGAQRPPLAERPAANRRPAGPHAGAEPRLSGDHRHPAGQIGFALASLAIVPLLYAGFAAPTWLRRAWRQGEESKFRQATHDIVIFSTDQTALARRALEWAVRLTGTDSGFFASGPTILAIHGMSRDEAEQMKALAGSGDRQRTVPLGGRPPRTAIVVGLPASEASIVLVGGPFTPVFGSDEQAWLQQYAS